MNYHNITNMDMVNGEGLRVVLWLSGCKHHCPGCHNPQTWSTNSGILFDDVAEKELMGKLSVEEISGITFSGGDPLHPDNRQEVHRIIKKIKKEFPKKTIWMYTGYTWEEIRLEPLVSEVDVLIDGRFESKLAKESYPWAGSTNQRVIDVQKTMEKGDVVNYANY